MKPSSAILLVSSMPGRCRSAFSASEMASPLATEETNKTAALAAANATLSHIPLPLFPDGMQSPSLGRNELSPRLPVHHARRFIRLGKIRVFFREKILDFGTMPNCRPTRAVVVEPNLPSIRTTDAFDGISGLLSRWCSPPVYV